MRSHLMHALPACLPTTPTSWTLFFTPENVCLGCRALSADIQKFLWPKKYQRLRINSMSWSQLWWSSSLICCWNKQICRLCVWVAAVAGCQRNGTQSCLYWRYFGFHCFLVRNLMRFSDYMQACGSGCLRSKLHPQAEAPLGMSNASSSQIFRWHKFCWWDTFCFSDFFQFMCPTSH